MKRALVAFVLGALSAAMLAGCGPASKTGTAVGNMAPPWSDPLSTGENLSSASLRGNPVYLNFFATWCPPCNEEARWIETLQRRYGSRGLHVVGIDIQENARLAQRFSAKYGLTYPIVVDSGTLQELYNINGLPVHVFIGRDGIIRRLVVGEMAKPEIEAAVSAILSH
ncbi:MAG TPA: TlpA disulfide reductase family protein [Candidatus Tyrphobacter sp.]